MQPNDVGTLPTGPRSVPAPTNGTLQVIPERGLEESLSSLKKEGLTTLQQLNKSGNLLIKSIERVASCSDDEKFCMAEVVNGARALAETAQAQANLVKVLKDFIR